MDQEGMESDSIASNVDQTPYGVSTGGQIRSSRQKCREASEMHRPDDISPSDRLSVGESLKCKQQDTNVQETGPRSLEYETLDLNNDVSRPANEITLDYASDHASLQPSDDFISQTAWKGQEVPYRYIAARYHIIWHPPLGHGTFGSVHEATDKETNEVYALKVINNFIDVRPELELVALQKVTASDRPDPHIIRVYDCWVHTNLEEHVSRTFIKMQKCKGTLLEYLGCAVSPITPLELTEIMIHILSGLCSCHKQGVCHRDLKLSNILYVEEPCDCHPDHHHMRWLITDFGFAMIFESGTMVVSHTRRGSVGYRAPELMGRNVEVHGFSSPGYVSRKADIWAIGCILFEVATGNTRRAFLDDFEALRYKENPGYNIPRLRETDNEALHLETLCPERGELSPFWKQLNEILGICFARTPEDRATATELKMRFEGMRNAVLLHSG